MTFRINGTTLQEPAMLLSEWVASGTALTRQYTLRYDALSGPALKAFLSRLTAAAVTMHFLDPLTDTQADAAVKPVSLSCEAAAERAGVVWYAPCTFVLKQA